MPVEPGQNLLHYRLVEKIGEGGMGVVWKALDTTLDREVAIKVLPAGFDQDPERLVRFEREAKLLASLNHPNIAGIFGLHELDDLRFIAMEHVPGEDLTQRIAAGPLDLEEALILARQVAAALATAHDNGIIHRDLKPANIRLTPDGTVKVLDFGLAKALDPTAASGPVNLTHSPTITSTGTRAGTILGTAAYMAPEQTRGKPVDRRADIWAFGCVLYEMLSGTQAFSGDTVTDVLAAILTREVDLEPLAARVPNRVTRLLRRCMTKDVSKRLRDAGDIGLELDAVLASDRDVEEDDPSPRRSWTALAGVAAVALAVGALLGHLSGGGGGGGESPGSARRLTVSTGDGRAIREATISRDGRLLILALEDGAFIRRLDRFELEPIPESAELTSWAESPDGRSIAFFTSDDQILGGGTLRRMSLETGTTVTLRNSTEGMHPLLWLDDGILVQGQDSIRRIDLASIESEVLLEIERGHSHGGSAVPGGGAFLLELHDPGSADEWSLALVDLATRSQRVLVPDARSGAVTTSDHLLFLRDDTLIASRFDTQELAAVGQPLPLISGVRSFSVSENGTLVYLPADESTSVSRIVRLDREGEAEPLYEGEVGHIRYGPDGRWISNSVNRSFLLVDARNGSVRPLLHEGMRFSDHVWRPDGQAVVYTAYPVGGGGSRLVEHPIDGRAPRVLLDTELREIEVFPTGYAPDSSGFIFARYEKDDTDLWWMPADGRDPRELLATQAFEDLARFAPNGRWVAYESTESGRQEVWVAVYHADGPRLAQQWKISQQGGRDPIWSPDGTELFYERFDGRLISVAVTSDPDGQPAFGDRTDMLDLRALGVSADGDQSYDVTPDGAGWIAVQGAVATSREVRIVLGWFDELDRLMRGAE